MLGLLYVHWSLKFARLIHGFLLTIKSRCVALKLFTMMQCWDKCIINFKEINEYSAATRIFGGVTAGPSGTSKVPPAPSAIPPSAFGVSFIASVTPTAASTVPADSPKVPASAVPADSLKVPAAVPSDSPNVPAASSSKEDRLGEEAAKRLHEEEMAELERERAEAQRKRQQDVLESAKFYNEDDWLNIRAQMEANASVSQTLLGDDVTEDNFPARMAVLIKKKRQALAEQLFKEIQNRLQNTAQQKAYMQQYVKNQSNDIYNTGWTMAYVKSFSDEQLIQEFEKIHKVQSQSQIQAFGQTLKRLGPVLEEPSTKKPKSPEAHTPSMPEVPISPAVTSPPSSRTRRKSIGQKHMHKPKSTLPTLDLDATTQTFLKVVVDEDSDYEDYVDEVWSTVVGWEILPTPLGEINALYRIDGSTKHFTNLRQILHLVDRQDLMKLYGSFGGSSGSYEALWISVKLMKKMLLDKLEIDSDFVRNDLTTAEQLIHKDLSRVVFNKAFLEEVNEEVTVQENEVKVEGHKREETTPLASKIPIVDYKIHFERNIPYFKINRADGAYGMANRLLYHEGMNAHTKRTEIRT
nr:JmjC domain-containing protein [Tanacetum cinerariifolium]